MSAIKDESVEWFNEHIQNLQELAFSVLEEKKDGATEVPIESYEELLNWTIEMLQSLRDDVEQNGDDMVHVTSQQGIVGTKNITISYEVVGTLEERNVEFPRVREATKETIKLLTEMKLNPNIAHFDWKGRLTKGTESKFSKIMRATFLRKTV